jgi:hypothetical protein
MRRIVPIFPPLSMLLLFLACGGRTGLLVPPGEAPVDAAVVHDASSRVDAEAGADVEDAPSFPDVPVVDLCPDAGSTLIYVLTSDNGLESFYPPTLTFTSIGTIDCPGESGNITPFSMAVDRRGIAYSVFTDGNLFRIDTRSAACVATTFRRDQSGFDTFGMGFVADTNDAGETLFVAEDPYTTGKQLSQGLASIDIESYALSFVGAFNPPIVGPELTGTADGALYAFYTNGTGTGSNIVQVDKTSGNILQDYKLVVGNPEDAYAFGYWGGDFWIFTGLGSVSQVTRYDPSTRTETPATTFDGIIVGAGVSTCAPQ